VTGPVGHTGAVSAPPPDPGTIGRYRLLRELGSGAMGRVYLAEDPALGRQVAIKVVHGGAEARAEAQLRFRREARISAQLNHPNVVTVLDVGEDPVLGPFLTLEYLEGESLETRLARGPLPPAEALPLLIQAIHALDAAHAAGIIHRDVKPGNLRIDGRGRLKLLDFGIALSDLPRITLSGQFFTPGYAAPELLLGREPDARTDTWAFAVTAFQCLTGTLPFTGETAHAILYQVAHGEPTLPATLHPALRGVFATAFAKDPGSRQRDLTALGIALIQAADLSPEDRTRCMALLHPSLPARASRARDRWGRTLALATGAVILATASFLFWPHPRLLSVTTTPPGAQVLLDGIPLGATPIHDQQIPTKARILRVTHPGFIPVMRTLEPGDRDLDITLGPEPRRRPAERKPGFWKRLFGK
jgi:serine/threonine protein kinase